jgi:2-polyprenyl-3-methyl-5-hydroxy-6-metoxy-1,4-benzoquinol methylase
MNRRSNVHEIEELRRVLTDGSRWHHEDRDADSRCGEQAFRDNAVRLLATMQLADPFTRSPNPRVLECGAGSLYTIEALRWRYGDHLSLYAVEHPAAARDDLRAELDARGVQYRPPDLLADSAPWPDVTFDLIILAEVIEHIPPTELPQMIRRLAGSLSEDGALLMSSPNSQAIWNVLSLAIGNGHGLDPAFPPESGSYGHIRVYARKEVEELLAYAGLRLQEWRLSNWHHAHPWPGTPLRDRIRLGIQRAAPTIVPRWASGWICTGTRAQPAAG